METFISESKLSDLSLCDSLIKYHEENSEYKTRGFTTEGEAKGGKTSTDVRVNPGTQNPIIQNYIKELVDIVRDYAEKYSIQNIRIKEAFNIQHYLPNEGYLTWHYERNSYQSDQRALVFMTYLNDVDDGGETEFKFQDIKVKAEKGKTLIWPTDFTHTHRGVVSKTEHKYIATGWINFFDVIDFQQVFFKK